MHPERKKGIVVEKWVKTPNIVATNEGDGHNLFAKDSNSCTIFGVFQIFWVF